MTVKLSIWNNRDDIYKYTHHASSTAVPFYDILVCTVKKNIFLNDITHSSTTHECDRKWTKNCATQLRQWQMALYLVFNFFL